MASQKDLLSILAERIDKLDNRVDELITNHLAHIQGELSKCEVRLTERLSTVEGKLSILNKVVWSCLIAIVVSIVIDLIFR